MKVYETMTPDVVMVGPEATLAEAARIMKDNDVGPLPVCREDHLVGMLTDRDITVRATATGRDPNTARVRDVMTPRALCCFETDDVQQAAEMMQDAQLRRLLVVDGKGRLVGIVSLGDIALRTGDEHLAGETLERVCGGRMGGH